MAPTVTLDRTQREAIHSELGITVSGYGDFRIAVANGDRDYCYRHIEQLRHPLAALDVSGWSEHPEAPDQQPVPLSESFIAWARGEHEELHASLAELGCASDTALDAFNALALLVAGGGA